MTTLAILQARMSSSRLPGKVLKPLARFPGAVAAFTSADIRAFLSRRPDLARFGGDRRL